MKRYITTFLSLLTLSLTSCQEVKNYAATYALYKLGNSQNIVEINVNDLEKYAKSGIGFNVILHNDTCSLCDTAMDVVKDTITETNYLFFGLEVDGTNASVLNEKLGDKIGDIYTPKVLTFSHKDLVYTYDSNNILRKTSFEKEVKRTTLASTHYFATDLLDAKEKFDSLDDAILISYSSRYDNSWSFFDKNIGVLLKSSKQNLIICDTFSQYLEEENRENFFYVMTKKAGVSNQPAYYLNPLEIDQALNIIANY